MEITKCPHCGKDVDMSWCGKEVQVSTDTVYPLLLKRLYCKHAACTRPILFIYRGYTDERRLEALQYGESADMVEEWDPKAIELIFVYPSVKTRFDTSCVPREIRDAFNEAERCQSVGGWTGVAACLRRCIYLICDDQKVEGGDYREKIKNLFPEEPFTSLASQIKFLGDNHLHRTGVSYKAEEVKGALDIFADIIEEIYVRKKKLQQVANLLNKGNQKSK